MQTHMQAHARVQPQELMLRGGELQDVLRLMVAMSEAGHGIPRKAFDMLRAEVLTTYGYEHALTLGALEKAGEVLCSSFAYHRWSLTY